MTHQSISTAAAIYDLRSRPITPAQEVMQSYDTELDDLIHSWRRVTDPKMRRLVLTLIRSMDDGGEPSTS
jgi:hypothetical protein